MRRFLVLPLSMIALAGCQTSDITNLYSDITNLWDPSPMGRGYSSFSEPYKSPPGPKPPEIGYEYSEEKNAEVLSELRSASSSLVTKLEETVEVPEKFVYVAPPPPRPFIEGSGAFYNSFDHVLREELISRGYSVTSEPQNATTLQFRADPPEGQNFFSETRPRDGRDFEITLIVGPEQKPEAWISDIYHVPAYGYGGLMGLTSIPEPAAGGVN